jgi:hypothetical protein
MTQDEIIEMARQAGIEFNKERVPETGFEYQGSMIVLDELEAFAKLVAAKEREACAKLAQETICDTHIPTGVNIYGTRVSKAIRARGEA